MQNLNSQIIIYKTEDGRTEIDVRFDEETVWLTQKLIAELFGVDVRTVNEHLKNIFLEQELAENSTIRKFRIVQNEAERSVVRDVMHYNLDAILAVGYRVRSNRGTLFRQWATVRLGEYIVKGFVLDDERLKNPDLPFDYFEDLTRRIADIRTSEKRFYRKITDIYATSLDYDPTNEQSIEFFKTVQNKVHYAITGKTAAEIVASRADSQKPNVGLTNFRGGKPTKEEAIVAKNYLSEQELSVLNNLIEQYLIFAEGQAMQRIPMHMKDWIKRLNEFLKLNRKDVLKGAGKISHELAKELAEREYDVYRKKSLNQLTKADNDFDALTKSATKLLKYKKKK